MTATELSQAAKTAEAKARYADHIGDRPAAARYQQDAAELLAEARRLGGAR